jgi:N-glycosylase/DNA lyase
MHSFCASSNQTVLALAGGELLSLPLPAPGARLGIGRLTWGAAEEIGTPAYWRSQAWMWSLEHADHFKLGKSLAEEVVACLLGGYGIPAEVGLAAYERVRPVLAGNRRALHASEYAIALLSDPLTIGTRQVRYRFARQKGAYLAAALARLEQLDEEGSDVCLRDALTDLPGIGLKTASWIVRNWRGSDQVAILDVHIIRAARMLKIFVDRWRVERHYREMERAYLDFAEAIGAPAALLDSVMWMTMRRLPPETVRSFVAPGYERAEKFAPSMATTGQLTAAQLT